MIITENKFNEMMDNVARRVEARVELYSGSTLVDTFTYDGDLQEFTVERAGDTNKFFGYGICQKLTVKILDRNRTHNIYKGQGLEAVFGVESDYVYPYPIFYVEDIERDENTNNLTLTAYDSIYFGEKHQLSELEMPKPYTIRALATACASFLGVPIKFDNVPDVVFDVVYAEGANYDGTESIRTVLDDIAEATGTIYYVNKDWELTFKCLDIDGESVINIDKSRYFTLSTKNLLKLEELRSVTELGDNHFVSTGSPGGEIQFIRENPFWNLRSDIYWLMDNVLDCVGGLKLTQFNCDWRGNFLLEIGDKISLTTKNDEIIQSYVLNDSITYRGGLKGNMSWEYSNSGAETDDQPSGIGAAFKQTFARVDRLSGQVQLHASQTQELQEQMANVIVNSEGITQTVSDLQIKTDELGVEVATVKNSVESAVTAEEVSILVNQEIQRQGEITSITTTTGFIFNEDGLSVRKTDSDLYTQITENGMTVSKINDTSALLTANASGVIAKDLRATTYIFIGGRCRFQNWTSPSGKARTGCWWQG